MKHCLIGAALVIGSSAAADVPIVSANGFVSHHVIEVPVAPETAYRTFARIGTWWDPDHTYSGSAARLSLSLRAGGCLCESLPNGGTVEHMRVAYVDPGKRVVLNGALGPLLYQAVVGVMDARFEKTTRGTLITLDYRVAGFAMNNGDKLAPLVDQVLSEQVHRLELAIRR
jgi:hypothetical protein